MAFTDYIGALASPVTGIVNSLLQNSENKKNREFAREMYQRQYVDNINLWHMQNMYNDPSQQMQRIHSAGLNPALMYQQGNTGVSPAAAHSAEYKPFNTPAPQFEKLDLLGQYYSVQNMRLQNEKIEQEIKESKSRVPLNEARTSRETVETRQITDNKEWLDMMAQARAESEASKSRLFAEQAHVYVDKEQKVDENGQPVFDKDGLPVYTENNYFDDAGNVISPLQYQFEVEMSRQRATINKVLEDTELTKAQFITELMKPQVMEAQIKYLQSAANLNYEQASNLYRMYTLGLLNYGLSREQFDFNRTNFQNWPQLLSRVLRWMGIDLDPNKKEEGPHVNPGGIVGVPFVGTPLM